MGGNGVKKDNVTEEKTYSYDEAAEYLGVTRVTVQNIVKRGDLPINYRKYGQERAFFLQSDLDKLMETTRKEYPKESKKA